MWEILFEMHKSMKSSSLGNISLSADESTQSMTAMYQALVTYENAINGGAQQQDWLRWKRGQWREQIRNPNNWSKAHFATCCLEVERHVLQEAQEPIFLAILRDPWRIRCVRAGGGEMHFQNTAGGSDIDGLTLLRLLSALANN